MHRHDPAPAHQCRRSQPLLRCASSPGAATALATPPPPPWFTAPWCKIERRPEDRGPVPSEWAPAGLPERYRAVVPGGELHGACGVIVLGDFGDGPGHLILFKDGFQGWSPCAFQRRSAVLTLLTGWRWRVESGVREQSGDDGSRLEQRLAAVAEVQRGVAVVPHQHNGTMGQPAAQLRDQPPGPVGDLLEPETLLLMEKTRNGSAVIKGYSPPAMPCDRVTRHEAVSVESQAALIEHRAMLDPVRFAHDPGSPVGSGRPSYPLNSDLPLVVRAWNGSWPGCPTGGVSSAIRPVGGPR